MDLITEFNDLLTIFYRIKSKTVSFVQQMKMKCMSGGEIIDKGIAFVARENIVRSGQGAYVSDLIQRTLVHLNGLLSPDNMFIDWRSEHET